MKINEENKALGARIREKREALLMDHLDLAQKLGCAPEHLRRIEEGRRTISVAHLQAAADALGVSVAALKGGAQ